MEIKIIPSQLKKHMDHIDEEIRVLRRMEEMAQIAYASAPNRNEIIASVQKLGRSIGFRREIFENMDEAINNQEIWLGKFIESLKESQRR